MILLVEKSKMHISRTTKDEFDNADVLKINFSGNVSCFGNILCQDIEVGIAWQSTLVTPYIHEVNNTLFIGVDLSFAVIDIRRYCIVKLLSLGSFFQTCELQQGKVFIFSELEVFVLDVSDYSELLHIDLPDILERYNIYGDSLTLTCMNGSEMHYKL
jgi:hypothetical protein